MKSNHGGKARSSHVAPQGMVHLGRSGSDEPKEATAANRSTSYPYGLEVSLEHDSMQKLGMHKSPPAAGSKVHAMVTMHVNSVRKPADGGHMGSLGLTITHMKIHPPSAPKPSGKITRVKTQSTRTQGTSPKPVKVVAHVRRAKGSAPHAPRPPKVPVVKPPTVHRVR